MDWLHESVRIGSDNAATFNGLTFLRMPRFPKPCERHWLTGLQGYVPRLFDASCCFPFVEARCWDDAAPILEG